MIYIAIYVNRYGRSVPSKKQNHLKTRRIKPKQYTLVKKKFKEKQEVTLRRQHPTESTGQDG